MHGIEMIYRMSIHKIECFVEQQKKKMYIVMK